MSIIHHLSVGTNGLAASIAFYDPIMALLGLRTIARNDRAVDYGVADTVFSVETPADGRPATAGNGLHIAFVARDRAMVDRFHELAFAHGGSDAGAPGIRAEYDAHYYAAFVRDPGGNKIEAVTYAAA